LHCKNVQEKPEVDLRFTDDLRKKALFEDYIEQRVMGLSPPTTIRTINIHMFMRSYTGSFRQS